MSGINKSKVKNPMPVQEPQVRAGNFSEVALGYTKYGHSGIYREN